ncbi:YfgJ family double zinc ribbon protein [Crassaminicella thermophila]|nr:zinc-ribbon domain-containing protein [Crassaminicella thermophila]
MECPLCGESMNGRGSKYYCDKCDLYYRVKFICEKCGNEPEEISSCGAVNYFCDTCKELKSRKQMKKEFIKE